MQTNRVRQTGIKKPIKTQGKKQPPASAKPAPVESGEDRTLLIRLPANTAARLAEIIKRNEWDGITLASFIRLAVLEQLQPYDLRSSKPKAAALARLTDLVEKLREAKDKAGYLLVTLAEESCQLAHKEEAVINRMSQSGLCSFGYETALELDRILRQLSSCADELNGHAPTPAANGGAQ